MAVTYCIGDLHGRADLLSASRSLIKFDAKKQGHKKCNIVYLGDYIDRGPDSKLVLENLINSPMNKDIFNEIFIKGNHEQMMSVALGYTNPPQGKRSDWQSMWLENGGIECLLSFGIFPTIPGWEYSDIISRREAKDPSAWSWTEIEFNIPKYFLEWIRDLPNTFCEGKYFFCHAGADPKFPIDRQSNMVYLWIRKGSLDHTGHWTDQNQNKYKLVHGHTPTKNGKVDMLPWRLNMDTGAVWTGSQAVAILGDTEKIMYTPVYRKA